MTKMIKLTILLVIVLLSQITMSQNCDSLKIIKLSTCDMDDITTVFRERSKFIKLNKINESIIKNDSIVLNNYKIIIKNDSVISANFRKNIVDKDMIISDQKLVIKSEEEKTLFWKTTTYVSSGAAVILLILTLLK